MDLLILIVFIGLIALFSILVDRPACYGILHLLCAPRQRTAGSTAPVVPGHNRPATATAS